MKSFFKEAISSINTSGTIKPSSKYLVSNCLKTLDLSNAETVVEFGPGNGCLTEKISETLSRSAQLLSLEINQTFFEYCQSKFSAHDNVLLLKESALNFDEVLKDNELSKVDVIVSSLPLTLFSEAEVNSLFSKVYKYLKAGGVFVQYQYSIGKYRKLKKTFDSVDVSLTLKNIPPAFVYKCRKFSEVPNLT